MRILRSALAVGVVSLLMADAPLDEGEYHCDEAVQHLQDCCPGYNFSGIDCDAGRGCDNKRPAIDDPEASTLRDLSCDDVRRRGYCDQPPVTPPSPSPGVSL